MYNGKSPDATPYADFTGSGTLLTRYLYGPGVINGSVVDEILARTSSGGTTAWYLPDKSGSVRDIVSSSGSLLDHIVYDSFGNILTETNASNGDRFKFAGMEYDSVTGLTHGRARYYAFDYRAVYVSRPRGLPCRGHQPVSLRGEPSNLHWTDPSGLLDEPSTPISLRDPGGPAIWIPRPSGGAFLRRQAKNCGIRQYIPRSPTTCALLTKLSGNDLRERFLGVYMHQERGGIEIGVPYRIGPGRRAIRSGNLLGTHIRVDDRWLQHSGRHDPRLRYSHTHPPYPDPAAEGNPANSPLDPVNSNEPVGTSSRVPWLVVGPDGTAPNSAERQGRTTQPNSSMTGKTATN